MKKKKIVLILSLVSLIVLMFLISLSVMITAPLRERLEIEAGEEVRELSFYKNPKLYAFLKKYRFPMLHVKMLTDLEGLSLNKIGEVPVQFLVNGKTRTSILSVVDTKSPKLVTKEVVLVTGDMPRVEDFVEEVEDETEVKLSIKGIGKYKKRKKDGVYQVDIIAEDSGGNKAVKKEKFYAFNLKKQVRAELGSKEFRADAFLGKKSEEGIEIRFRNGFDVKPSLEYVGKYSVPLTVFMGKEEKEIDLKLIVEDTKKPEFFGVDDFDIYMGEDVSYRKGVYVKDNQKKEIDFDVDASKVNLKKEGSYPVYYKAKDEAGNKTKKKIQVRVFSANKSHIEEVKKYVKDTLKEITKENMTDLEKLRAIFQFCNQISYVGTSEKGSLVEAAYQGFRTQTGDCFTYYSVAKLLLVEAGFDEMMVEREKGSSKHYWNLVKYEKEWYHFDSCPLAGAGGFHPFMVSDEELLTFSKKYGVSHPSKNGYYNFNKERYPERAKTSLK